MTTNPDLEKLIHQELQKLPELTAPATLIPGVLAAIQQRAAAPWWRQAWWDWPAPAKLNMSADPHLDGCADPLSVYEGTEAGVGVGNDPMTFGESKVGVLARNHRPLFL